jgi:formylglycine-generating enzyme required for sulfatase activity
MFLFILYCALLTTFVFSGKDAAANSCTTACNSKATKDCGCSKTSRTNSYTKETSKDHEKFKWTEPHPTEQDHGLQYGLMVLLQGGEFVMGTNNPKIVSDGEGPARRVKLNAFYMDQYEVCNHDFEMFVNKTGYITEVSIRAKAGGVYSIAIKTICR